MPLWLTLALIYVVMAAVNIGAVWYYISHVLASLVTGPDFINAQWFAAVMVGLFQLLVAGLFLILARVIALPVRSLARSMKGFTGTGARTPVVLSSATPREIVSLAAAFADMAQRIETTHGHDEEISRVKSDFISTAAHQLRTPLTAVRWALEALQKSGLTPDQAALADSAAEKSKDLVAIVGTLLDISSIESGKYQYDFKSVDLAKLAADIARDFGHIAAEKQVSLYFTQDAAAPPPVRADGERIKWVLNNLVENAVRYTPAGGTVRITTEASGDRVYLRVHDTGIGIPSSDRGSIFERFYRAGNAIQKENEGNGLGLYIARQIAKDHGGDLTFEANAEGPGTTFTLSLPLRR